MRKRREFTFSLSLYTNLTMCRSEKESFKIAFEVNKCKLIVWKGAKIFVISHNEMWPEEYKKIKKHGRNLKD